MFSTTFILFMYFNNKINKHSNLIMFKNAIPDNIFKLLQYLQKKNEIFCPPCITYIDKRRRM